MVEYVDLEMTYTLYSRLCDAVMIAADQSDGFFEMQEWVHLFDFLEKEYIRNREKMENNIKKWNFHQNLLINNEKYHPIDFLAVKKIFDEYENEKLLEWNISE